MKRTKTMGYDKSKALKLIDEATGRFLGFREIVARLPEALSEDDGSDMDTLDCGRLSDDLSHKFAEVTAALGVELEHPEGGGTGMIPHTIGRVTF
jgi:hypothetical protein